MEEVQENMFNMQTIRFSDDITVDSKLQENHYIFTEFIVLVVNQLTQANQQPLQTFQDILKTLRNFSPFYFVNPHSNRFMSVRFYSNI